jgi:hypothetical protein
MDVLRLLAFFSIVIFLAFSGWIIDNTSLGGAARVLTFSTDVGMIVLALPALKRSWTFFGTRSTLVFILLSIVTIAYNLDRIDFVGQLNGIRLPFFFFMVLVVVHDFLRSDYAYEFQRYFTWFLISFALAQTPTSFAQFLKYGPGDDVGGTLGWGGTNVVSLSLFLLVFHFIVRFGSDDTRTGFKLSKIMLFSLLLFPCGINETKISFILLAVLVFLLVPRRRLSVAIPVIVVGAVLFYVLNFLYSTYQSDTANLLDEGFLERYLLYNENAQGDLPRGQKMLYTFDLMANDPPTYAVGMGYGVFMGGNLLRTSSFGYVVGYLAGARMFLNTIWLQGGLLAVLAIAFPLFHFLSSKNVQSSNMKKFKWFLFVVLAAMWVYNDSLHNRCFAAIVAYLILWTEMGGIDTQTEGDDADEDPDDIRRIEPLQQEGVQ